MTRGAPATLMLAFTLAGAAAPVAAQESLDALFEDEPEEREDTEAGFETRLELDSERLSAAAPGAVASDAHTLGLELGGYLPFGPDLAVGVGVAAELEALRDEDSPRGDDGRPRWRDTARLALDELYVERAFGASRQLRAGLGRRELDDGSGWWWDAPFDALFAFVRSSRLDAAFVAGRLAPDVTTEADVIEPGEKSVLWALGSLHWPRLAAGEVSLFALTRHDASASTPVGARVPESDADASDADLTWLGLRVARGLERPRIGRWHVALDAGVVGGRERSVRFEEEEGEEDADDDGEDDGAAGDVPGLGEDAAEGVTDEPEVVEAVAVRRQDVGGWAFDLALGWRAALPTAPELVLRYAGASGSSDEGAAGSRTFRPSGLDGDAGELARYGELYDPALANIEIASLSFGLSPWSATRFVVAHHRYRRRVASGAIGETGLDAEPARADRDLGSESGLYLAARPAEDIELRFSWSRFRPGRAYAGEIDRALTRLELTIEVEL